MNCNKPGFKLASQTVSCPTSVKGAPVAGLGVGVGWDVGLERVCGASGVCSNDKVGTNVGTENSAVVVEVDSSANGVSWSGVLLTAVKGVLANGVVAKGVFVIGVLTKGVLVDEILAKPCCRSVASCARGCT